MLEAEYKMDDGTPIRLRIQISEEVCDTPRLPHTTVFTAEPSVAFTLVGAGTGLWFSLSLTHTHTHTHTHMHTHNRRPIW